MAAAVFVNCDQLCQKYPTEAAVAVLMINYAKNSTDAAIDDRGHLYQKILPSGVAVLLVIISI